MSNEFLSGLGNNQDNGVQQNKNKSVNLDELLKQAQQVAKQNSQSRGSQLGSIFGEAKQVANQNTNQASSKQNYDLNEILTLLENSKKQDEAKNINIFNASRQYQSFNNTSKLKDTSVFT